MEAILKGYRGLSRGVFASAPRPGSTLRRLGLGLLAAAALAILPDAGIAKTLRVSAAGDAGTLDPHSQNVATTSQLLRQIYEPLVGRGRKLELEPALAVSWSQIEPTRWRFKLRADARFHDGSPFTAEDVVFSLKRVAAPGSNYNNFVDTVLRGEVVDAATVDIVTSEPDPILLDKLTSVAIMSKAWSEANHVELPQNAAQREESFATRRTNGTGPFLLESREPTVKTVLTRFAGWWGKPEGNVTEYVSLPISSAATRVAALLSGQTDLLLDPPLQDIDRMRAAPQIRVVQGPEIRTMFIVMDQERDELLYSDVKGKNPFKDLRVRQALYLATDIEAIRTKIMRGFALPTGLLFGPGVRGYAKDIDGRLPLDRAKARTLLAEASYPNGFSVTLDCPNNRYVNDQDVCTALAVMWTQIGVKTTVNAQPLQLFFPKVQRRDMSMFFLGSGSATFDAYYMFQIHLLAPTSRPGDGAWNLGGYNNPRMNELIGKIRVELDPSIRDGLIRDALLLYQQDVANLPLYHQEIAWAMRSTVKAEIRADNQLEAKWVTVD